MLLAARSWQTETRQKSSYTSIRSQFAWRCLFCGKFPSLQSELPTWASGDLALAEVELLMEKMLQGGIDLSCRKRTDTLGGLALLTLVHWSWDHAWRDLVVRPARAFARLRCGSSLLSKCRAGRAVRVSAVPCFVVLSLSSPWTSIDSVRGHCDRHLAGQLDGVLPVDFPSRHSALG